MRVFFRMRTLDLPWNTHTLHDFWRAILPGILQALISYLSCWLGARPLSLEDQQDGLNPFRVTLFKQVVLVLPLQRAHAQYVACKFCIREGLDLLRIQTCTRTVEQTLEVLNVTVQLQYSLHKLTNVNLVGLLEEVHQVEPQVFCWQHFGTFCMMPALSA